MVDILRLWGLGKEIFQECQDQDLSQYWVMMPLGQVLP